MTELEKREYIASCDLLVANVTIYSLSKSFNCTEKSYINSALRVKTRFCTELAFETPI